jgi:hypothetical protein
MIRPIGIDCLGVIFNGQGEITSLEGLVPSLFELFGFFDVGHGAFDYGYERFGNGYNIYNTAKWHGMAMPARRIFEDFFCVARISALPAKVPQFLRQISAPRSDPSKFTSSTMTMLS